MASSGESNRNDFSFQPPQGDIGTKTATDTHQGKEEKKDPKHCS